MQNLYSRVKNIFHIKNMSRILSSVRHHTRRIRERVKSHYCLLVRVLVDIHIHNIFVFIVMHSLSTQLHFFFDIEQRYIIFSTLREDMPDVAFHAPCTMRHIVPHSFSVPLSAVPRPRPRPRDAKFQIRLHFGPGLFVDSLAFVV